MENIIGWIIGIPLLLVTAYVVLSIPYSVIVKPLYKAIKKTPTAFKNTSAKLQRNNTRGTLKRLIDAMLEAEKNIHIAMETDGNLSYLPHQVVMDQLMLMMIEPNKIWKL